MTAAVPPEAEASAKASGMSTKTMMIAVAALVVGGAVGKFVVGPKMGGAPKAPAEAGAEGAGHEGGKEGKDGKAAEPKIVRLDNIIVNPAGSMGQHFLIVSLAVELTTSPSEERLKRTEVPFRDAITGVLERMTLTQLTQLGARDSVRNAITDLARRFAADPSVKVYLPQFLIQ